MEHDYGPPGHHARADGLDDGESNEENRRGIREDELGEVHDGGGPGVVAADEVLEDAGRSVVMSWGHWTGCPRAEIVPSPR